MWEVLVRTPRGSIHPRKFSLLLATFLMVLFGYIVAVAPTASAAPDATWDSQSISYGSDTYDVASDTAGFPSQVANSPAVYQYIDTSKTPNVAHFIYFANSNAQSEKEATYVRYTLNPPNSYSNKAGEKTISITPVPEDEQLDTDDANIFKAEVTDSCTIDGVGWLVCPIMHSISETMDFIFERIRGFLVVQPITNDINSPIYRIWQISRDLANIAFVIGFLVIIYNYIVGGGASGYEIRRIIPRLVIAAILINISYVICAVAVDISNITGYGVNQLFETVRDNTLSGASAGDEVPVNWTSVTTWVLAGGAGAGAALAIPGAVGGAAGLMWGVLLPFLVAGALLVMVTFIILAARQALIIIAIAIAPLAFAAYILPNTEKWFDRWRDLFFTMLVMFPAFAAVFGGAQLAGEVIIRSANSIELIILGLGVMVAPLAITPLLLKLGGGILNRFANMVNNPQKGIHDRVKNYGKDRQQDLIASRQAANAEARRTGDYSNFRAGTRRWRRRAGTNYAKATYRKEQRKLNEEATQNSWHGQHDRWGGDSHAGDDNYDSHLTRRNQAGRGNLDFYKRDNQLRHDQQHAHHEEHWQDRLNSDGIRRGMLTDTRLTEGRAKIIQGAHEAQDERTLQTALNTDAGYANLRNMKVQTSVDSGVAEVHKNAVEAAGKLALSTEVSNDRALRVMKVDTHATQKTAETMDSILQKNAEANWNNISKNDANVQALRLRENVAIEQANQTEQAFNRLVADAKANGANAKSVAAQNRQYAQAINTAATKAVFHEKATAAITSQFQSAAEQVYVESSEGRVLNVRTQAAADTLEAAKATEAALVQEWRTEKGAEGLMGEELRLANALREANIQKRTQTQRTGAATRVTDVEYAMKVQDDATGLATVAGGIEGTAGVSQAKSVAFKTIVDAFNTGVSAEKTLFSRTENDELLGDTMLGSANILDEPSERIAAIAGTIAGRQHQMSHIKLWKRMGELQIEATNELAAATASGDQAAIEIAKDKVGKVKDLQQQVMGDKKKTPFGVGDSDQGAAEIGDYKANIYKVAKQRITTHLSGQRLAGMDPDDIRLLFEMARSGKLNDAEVAKIHKAYDDWQKDDNLKSSIEEKHRVLLDPISQFHTTHNQGAFPPVQNPTPTDPHPFWEDRYDLTSI